MYRSNPISLGAFPAILLPSLTSDFKIDGEASDDTQPFVLILPWFGDSGLTFSDGQPPGPEAFGRTLTPTSLSAAPRNAPLPGRLADEA